MRFCIRKTLSTVAYREDILSDVTCAVSRYTCVEREKREKKREHINYIIIIVIIYYYPRAEFYVAIKRENIRNGYRERNPRNIIPRAFLLLTKSRCHSHLR